MTPKTSAAPQPGEAEKAEEVWTARLPKSGAPRPKRPTVACAKPNKPCSISRSARCSSVLSLGPYTTPYQPIHITPEPSACGGRDFRYGWIRLRWDPDSLGLPLTLKALDWAYNTNLNRPIHVGSVPEPGTLSLTLLAAGAVGVLAWRKRRNEST